MTGSPLLASLDLWLRVVPDGAHVALLSRTIDRVLRNQGQAAELAPLEGQTVGIEVSDTGNRWRFQVNHGRLRTATGERGADVWIRGRLADFLLLAVRGEDPDTLFFQRRLVIEGDTEAGLMVKYLIDAFELDWEAQLGALIGTRRSQFIARRVRRAGLDQRCARIGKRLRNRLVPGAEQRPSGRGDRSQTATAPSSQTIPGSPSA